MCIRDRLSATQLNAKANAPGKMVYTPVLGSKLPAGTQTLTGTFTPTDPTHYAIVQSSVTLTVTPVVAKVTIGGTKQPYNGQPRPVTVTTVPAGLLVDVTYSSATYPVSANAPANAGSYAVAATVNDPNGTGTTTGTLVVDKGKQTITFPTPPALHNGDADYLLSLIHISEPTRPY